jgi:hypothetical protein
MVFDLQRKRPAAEARSQAKGRWREIRNSELCSAKDETSRPLKQGLGVGKGRELGDKERWALLCKE